MNECIRQLQAAYFSARKLKKYPKGNATRTSLTTQLKSTAE